MVGGRSRAVAGSSMRAAMWRGGAGEGRGREVVSEWIGEERVLGIRFIFLYLVFLGGGKLGCWLGRDG